MHATYTTVYTLKKDCPKGSYIRDLIFPERIGIVVKCGYAVFSSFPGMSIAPMQL